MHRTYTLNNPYGKTNGRFFWQDSFEPQAEKGICFVPESLIDAEGKLEETFYLNNGWARLNCGSQAQGHGSHMFPDMQQPVLEDQPEVTERIKTFLAHWD